MSQDLQALAAAVQRADLPSVARAISLVEDRRESQQEGVRALLDALGAAGRGQRVGITGPPGVGKSTLMHQLCREGRARQRTVGVLAVDPSSARSGGALLGDRARVQLDPDDAGVFFRSMASGGQLGGLARAAGAAVEVLSAAFDWVLLETTGVGQSETDVEHIADTVALVVQPGSGDVLQFIKSGILEIPDVLVVNKSDLGTLAQRTERELKVAVQGARQAGRSVPVLLTDARSGSGVAELVDALDTHWQSVQAQHQARRLEKQSAWGLRLFTQRCGELGVLDRGGARALRQELENRLRAGQGLLSALHELELEARRR